MFYARTWSFIHIPKTGGTNLYVCGSYFDDVFKANVDEQLVIENTLQKHNTIHYWKKYGNQWYFDLPFAAVFNRPIYTLVRNPYSRIVSFWSHMQFQKHFTFEEFIKDKKTIYDYYPGNTQHIDWDIFMPQVDYIDDSVKVYKMETNMQELEKSLGFPFADHKAYVGNHSDYRLYYTDELQELVYNYFEPDFTTFGYSKDL